MNVICKYINKFNFFLMYYYKMLYYICGLHYITIG